MNKLIPIPFDKDDPFKYEPAIDTFIREQRKQNKLIKRLLVSEGVLSYLILRRRIPLAGERLGNPDQQYYVNKEFATWVPVQVLPGIASKAIIAEII